MLDNLLTQLRTNPRLRWGVALIIGIAWLYGVLLLRDAAQDQTQQQRAAAQSVARLRATLTQGQWAARLPAANALAVQLESKLWQAPTPGLAQAALQDWLGAALTRSGVVNRQISVTVLEETIANLGNSAPPGLWRVKAKLGFEYTAPSLLDFLSQLEANDRQSIVGVLTVRKEPSPRVELEVDAYFQKQATPGVKPAKEAGAT
jgi:hypothetical protein